MDHVDSELFRSWFGGIVDRALDIISSIVAALESLDAWVTDTSNAIRDILSWDAILDKLYLYFPFLRDFAGQVWDRIRAYIDTYFPWLYDPELTIWDWVSAKARDLAYHLLPWSDLPEMGVREEAELWFLGILYRILPWGDDPDLTMLEEARAWVSELLPELPDIRELIGDALMWFLGVAGWPLLRAGEAFILNIWEVAEVPFDWTVYDLNGDGVISAEEALRAVADFYAGIITQAELNIVLAHREGG